MTGRGSGGPIWCLYLAARADGHTVRVLIMTQRARVAWGSQVLI